MAPRRLTALAAVAAVLLTAPAAYAAGSPPATHPDTVTLHAGESVLIDAADNDGDPDGDSLQVCRLGPDVPRALSRSFVEDGDLVVAASPRARGTYTFTYYVCDTTYLAAGTVTVHVKPPPATINVIPIGDAPPGRVRIVNTYKHRTFRCEWRPLGEGEEKTEGKVTVRPRSSVVIRVHEANFEVDCESGNVGYSFGFVTGRAPVVHRTDRARAGRA
jgi:hypothetical protein